MRFNAETIDKYGGHGGAGYFSLKNDKDVARVRFLYNNADDIEGYAVHQVEIDGKKRYVNCLREYNQPIDDCPFCKAKKFQTAKLFIPLYNEDEGKVQVWERGKKFFAKMSGICARYGSKRPIVQMAFDVERNGKPGSTDTVYEIYPTDDVADVTLDDYDMPEVLGSIVLDKSADDMEFYLENNYFPPEDGDRPVRRSARQEESDEEEAPRHSVRRRTPARDFD